MTGTKQYYITALAGKQYEERYNAYAKKARHGRGIEGVKQDTTGFTPYPKHKARLCPKCGGKHDDAQSYNNHVRSCIYGKG